MVEKLKEEILEKEIVQDEQKVEAKSKKRTKAQTKECKVLIYNAVKKYIVIDFDGNGFRLDYDGENPGDVITVKYSGKIATNSFKLSLA